MTDTKIYVDVLIFVNLIIGLFLIRACDSLLHRKAKPGRIILADIVCALSSLVIFLPELNIPLNLLIKAIVAFTVTSCAFGFKSIKQIIINWAAFFLISIAFAAVMTALWMFISPAVLTVANGSVYLDLSPLALIIGSAGCYCIIILLERIFKRRLDDSLCYDITVTVDGKTAAIPAVLDTGNRLIDPLSGCPVIVAQYDILKPLFAGEKNMRRIWTSPEKIASDEIGEQWKKRYRCVAFSSIGGKGMLCGFKPDETYIKTESGTVSVDCIVAVYDGRLFENGHTAIFGKELLDGIKVR